VNHKPTVVDAIYREVEKEDDDYGDLVHVIKSSLISLLVLSVVLTIVFLVFG